MAVSLKLLSPLAVRGKFLSYTWWSRMMCNCPSNRSNSSWDTTYKDNAQSSVEQKPSGLADTEDSCGKSGSKQDYFSMSQSFQRSESWRSKLLASMLVYPNFITPEEEAEILREIEPYISRLHYESSHWDDAIHNYRETERAKWNKKNSAVINRIRNLCFPVGVPQLRFVHILDLEKNGVIKPHIDSVRFCGNTIAGLSLLSDSIMRLRHDVQKDFYCDVLLPRFSLYAMKDFVRYEFTHEILAESESKFKDKVVPRDRRISVICRNEPETSANKGPVFTPLES